MKWKIETNLRKVKARRKHGSKQQFLSISSKFDKINGKIRDKSRQMQQA